MAVDPGRFDRRRDRRKVVLPTYPFERQRYWIDAAPAVPTQPAAAAARTTGEQAAAPSTVDAAPAPVGLARKLAGLFSFASERREPAASQTASRSAPAAVEPLHDLDPQQAGLSSPALSADLHDARERWLAAVFADLSGVAEVGRDDNFFQLGGDSLAAVQLMRRIEQATGVRLNLLRLAKGTVGSLARELPPMDAAGAPGERNARAGAADIRASG